LSEEIINAIRLLVEDGAEVTYTRDSQQPTDFYQGRMKGMLDEQQRIIRIIEKRKAYDCTCSCDCHSDTSPCTACKADNELIEIIKGENK